MPADKRTLVLAIQTRLEDRQWGGTGSVVFGNGAVRVVQAIDAESALRTMRVPLALIIPGAFRSDPDHAGQQPDYLVGTVTVRIATAHRGDEIGELAVVGGHRPSSTASEGAGLLQIEQEVQAAIGTLDADESVEIQFRDTGDQGTLIHPQHKFVAWIDMVFEAVCTRTA